MNLPSDPLETPLEQSQPDLGNPLDDPGSPTLEATGTGILQSPSISPRERIVKQLKWFGSGFVLLLVFTWSKLPDDKIKNYVNGLINQQLAPMGMQIKAEDTRLSLLGGVYYTMKKVSLGVPIPPPSPQIEQLDFSPSLLKLLVGKLSGQVWLKTKTGKLWGEFSVRGNSAQIDFKISNFDLGRLGVIPKLSGLQNLGVASDAIELKADGYGSFSGSFDDFKSLEGNGELAISNFSLEPQNIFGFAIPRIRVSKTTTSLLAEKGKLVIKSLDLGGPTKEGRPSADDLRGTLSGEVLLGQTIDSSTVNLQTRFSISDEIKKSLVLLDTILGPGKTPDGSFAFTVTGPVSAMNALPAGH